MSLTTYPISLPATPGTVSITIKKRTVVALASSPFSLTSQAQVWPGQQWFADLVLPKMKKASAEPWVAAFASLNGQEGSLLIGDTANKAPAGSAAGSWTCSGATTAGLYTFAITGGTGTFNPGDWIQLGSGSTARLYKVISHAAGNLTVWPSLRAAYAGGSALTYTPAQGRFMLAKEPEYTIGRDHIYSFGVISLMEDLRP